MSLLFKTYSLLEVIHLLNRFNKIKSFLRNTKNTDRNSINGQNTFISHLENCSDTEELISILQKACLLIQHEFFLKKAFCIKMSLKNPKTSKKY